jgi:hypothetical protein
MKHPTQKQRLAVKATVLLAALAAFITTGHAQSVQQLTNGLVDYYPLNTVFASVTTNLGVVSTNYTTPDLISRRDMTMYRMNSANVVADSHPGIEPAGQVMNMNQSGGNATFIYYQTTGQNATNGSGDFLPFINQRNATMNFWFKGTNTTANEYRVMAETDNGGGDNNPFFSISDTGTAPARFFLRGAGTGTDPNGVTCYVLEDGTYELPAPYYTWQQPNEYTTSNLYDNSWHMLTVTIAANGDVHTFVDGAPDPGTPGTSPAGPANLDNEGNQSISPPIYVTNFYYTTNIYPAFGVSNPPPNGYVDWFLPKVAHTGVTVFGGFLRNGTFAAGLPGNMSDIGFWNRVLATNEVQFLATNGFNTNGVFALSLNTNAIVASLSADFGEVGQKHTVTVHWSVTGANNTPGGVVITGIGDVSSSPSGSATVTLGNNASYTYTLTAHNGVVADVVKSVSVVTLNGVPSNWNLIQRFDGLFANTTAGINGNGWIGLQGIFSGGLDRFNVVTVNGNKVLSPKSDYNPDVANSPVGWDSRGALAYGFLNGLTIPPYQQNTLFFRFSVAAPTPIVATNAQLVVTNLYSGLDFAVGVSDFGFATGPLGGSQPPGGGGTVGPGFHILQFDSTGGYQPQPWDLTADDYNGTSVTNSYDYLTAASGSPSGLATNVTYYCWLDISNDNTMQNISGGVTNTINEPLYSLWIQKQGDPSRTLLFSGYHGDRNYATAGQNSDNPTPFLNKVFVSVATENVANNDSGSFFATNNMILSDDFYLSTNGLASSIPRLFNLTSIVRGATNATINWESLGSMFQLNTYSVQRTFSLSSPSWVTLTNGLPSGGDFTSFTDNTVGSATVAFYRISWP